MSHQCHPSKLAGRSAHSAARGSVVECGCGKRWRVTKTHHGRLCGCGWALLAADGSIDCTPTASTKGLPKMAHP